MGKRNFDFLKRTLKLLLKRHGECIKAISGFCGQIYGIRKLIAYEFSVIGRYGIAFVED